MTAGLRALLEGIIDYAGLFPPAALSMKDAVDEYAGQKQWDEAWMLAHFICPAARLDEFARHAASHDVPNSPWTLSILGGTGDTVAECKRTLARDMAAAHAALEMLGERAELRALETRLPVELREADTPAYGEWLENMAGALTGSGIQQVFVELPSVSWRSDLPRWFARLAGALPAHGPTIGVKIRTGGIDAAAFPEPEAVAAFLILARTAGLPLKATAGLHHPVRHFADSIGTKMHGFLNLFVAAALARSSNLDRPTLVRVLEDEDASAFVLDDACVGWRGLTVPVSAVREMRVSFALSYGSCSFAEPVEDLRTLGFLH